MTRVSDTQMYQSPPTYAGRYLVIFYVSLGEKDCTCKYAVEFQANDNKRKFLRRAETLSCFWVWTYPRQKRLVSTARFDVNSFQENCKNVRNLHGESSIACKVSTRFESIGNVILSSCERGEERGSKTIIHIPLLFSRSSQPKRYSFFPVLSFMHDLKGCLKEN